MYATTGFDEIGETRAYNARMTEELSRWPSLAEVDDPVASRAARTRGEGPYPAPVVLPEGRDETIAGVGVRIFTPPAEARGVYLHLHGGGWTLGSAAGQDVLLWELAKATRAVVISVDYRLAPEHPYPAGPDDCEAVALWLARNAAERYGTGRLVIGGESAGAHLAAVTLLRLRDRHGVSGAFRAAVLSFGVYDLSGTPSQRRFGTRNLSLTTPVMDWFVDQYVPDARIRRDPDVSPLYHDLSELPPGYFVVGTGDLLLDDTLFMEARWRAAGHPTALEVVAEAGHGFYGYPIRVAWASLGRLFAYVDRVLEGD